MAGDKRNIHPVQDGVGDVGAGIGITPFFQFEFQPQHTEQSRMAVNDGIGTIAADTGQQVIDHHAGGQTIDLVTVVCVGMGFNVGNSLHIAGVSDLQTELQPAGDFLTDGPVEILDLVFHTAIEGLLDKEFAAGNIIGVV